MGTRRRVALPLVNRVASRWCRPRTAIVDEGVTILVYRGAPVR